MSILSLQTLTVDVVQKPNTGGNQQIFRIRTPDMKDVERAATLLGMTKTDFIRRLVVNGAKSVLSEAGETPNG
jgi:uncharacterized protein (DUF1778 family)